MSTHAKFAIGHFLMFSLWLAIMMTGIAKVINEILGDLACTIISFALTLPFTSFVMAYLFSNGGVLDGWIYIILVFVAVINSWCVGGILSLFWKAISGHFSFNRKAKAALKKVAEQENPPDKK